MANLTLAAMRAGILQIVIPKLNEKDLPDLPEEVKKKLKFTPVDNVDEVLAAALANHRRQPPLETKTAEHKPVLDHRRRTPRRK